MKPQKLFYILLTLWVIIDIWQSVITPLHPDEAYYALYGRSLDWGYYDHPPMVAVLTALSSKLFSGNLSIRFMTALLHGATVWLTGLCIEEKLKTSRDVAVFLAIAASMPVFVIYGFITTPDAPLLFFTALFFFLYGKFVRRPSWPLAGALAVAIAAMLYSKYMAVLVVGFVLLSNLRLLKDPKAWFAVALAAILFLPHILWQFHNDFPSMQYHLVERNSSFKIRYLLEFPLLQLLVFNPVCLIFAIYFCWKNRKTEDLFLRACGYTAIGFIAFFWAMTFKGHAEPHWTMAVSVPVIIIVSDGIRTLRRRWTIGISSFAVLLLLARPFVPLLGDEDYDVLEGCDFFYNQIAKESGDSPVIIPGSFQIPSVYWFYSGGETTALSSVYSRRTQFDIWQLDRKYQGKPVVVLLQSSYRIPYPEEKMKKVSDCSNHEYNLLKVNSFQGANRIAIDIDKYRINGDSLYLNLTLHNTYDQPFVFAHPELPVSLYVAYKLENETCTISCRLPENMVIPTGRNKKVEIAVKHIPDAPILICLDNLVCRSVNSKPLIIK